MKTSLYYGPIFLKIQIAQQVFTKTFLFEFKENPWQCHEMSTYGLV
jgi:hypothetical protein